MESGCCPRSGWATSSKTAQGLFTPSVRTRAGNQINQKHVDFLLVRTSDLTPVAGLELDDSSHGRADRQKRDAFVDDVFRSCSLPLLHVPAQASYSAADLRTQITALLNQAEPASLVQPAPERINAAGLPVSNTTAQVHGAEIPPSLPSQPQAGDSCPRCSDGRLVQRTKRSTQGKFLGCSNYPRCGHTKNL
ncbi:MAG: DUF2726 domain-containing protein [Opitutaceae bacterium]|nr:DUF2726 domain-containing protein [Opitutaceae bacterium]